MISKKQYLKECVPMKFTLKEALKRARNKAELTQKELSEQFVTGENKDKVTLKTVKNWEQGKAAPSLATLIDLSEFYNCDLDYLVGRIDCRTHDLQFIQDYTGLSEDAVTALHLYKNADDRRSLWPSYLSDIINNKDFFTLMGRISEFMGNTKLEARFKDYASKMEMIDKQAADHFYINHIFTNILDAMAAHERSRQRSR
jgi:transcriptional regulator with XRE-family HTH domain